MYFAKLAISMYSRQGSVDRLLKTPFDHISKHLEDRQKYFAARRIFTYLLDVWKLWPNSIRINYHKRSQKKDHLLYTGY